MCKFGSVLIVLLLLILIIIAITCSCTSERAEPTPSPSPTLIPSPLEPPEIEWAKTFGGSEMDYPSSVQQTADGGYIVAGETYSYGAGGKDCWLVKTNDNGEEQWSRTFGGPGDDWANSLRQTADNGYIIAGCTYSYDVAVSAVLLIKTDENGNDVWFKTIDGPKGEGAYSVQQTADYGYIIAGTTYSYGAGHEDFWLVKTDAEGEVEWSKTLGSQDHETARSVWQTSDGGYIIVGGTSQNVFYDNSDVLIVKTDEAGNETWSKTLGGDDDDAVFSVQQTSDGGYITAGSTKSHGAGYPDIWLIKLDSNGEEVWERTFGGLGGARAYSMQQTTDMGYIIAGTTQSFGAGSFDCWLVKTDAEGEMQWNKTFGGPEWEAAYCVQETSDGGYIVVGSTDSYGAGSFDFWLVKLK